MTEREIAEKMIADGEKMIAEAKKKLGEIENPNERHGAYGYDADGDPCMSARMSNGKLKDVGPLTVFEHCVFHSSDPSFHVKDYKGNIFDDLERNMVDLDEFWGLYANGEKIMRISIDEDLNEIEFQIDSSFFTTTHAETVKIHQKLGQLLATFEREHRK